MLPTKKVKELIHLMNSVSNAHIPSHPAIIEMFSIAMDEKMLDYLLEIKTEYYTKEDLKKIYESMYQDDFEPFWLELKGMSFIHPKSHEEREYYQLSPIFPGWVEFSIGGQMNEKREAILNKFMEFWKILKVGNIAPVRYLMNLKGMKKLERGDQPRISTYTSHSKMITLNRPLETKQEILVKGDIYTLLEKHKDEIAVMNCFCRQYKKIHNQKDCDFGLPIEGCVSLGALSKQLIDNGIARKLDYQEALALFEEFQRKGCIHTTFHYHNDASLDELIICNCCVDCCLLYKDYREGSLSNIFARSFYSPKMINESACIGCNLCGKYCPTQATYYDKKQKKLIFNYDSCIGCGQCVNQCKFSVREMIPDTRDVFAKTKKKTK